MAQTESGSAMLNTMSNSKTKISINIDKENVVLSSDGFVKGGVTEPTTSQMMVNGKPEGEKTISKANIIIYKAGIEKMANDNDGKISIGGQVIDTKNVSISQIMASFGVHEGTHATDKSSSSSLNPKASKAEIEKKPYENQLKFLGELLNIKPKQ